MSNKNVHTEHCCVVHGCKYGDFDCPVWLGQQKQSFACESCFFEFDYTDKYAYQYASLVPTVSAEELKRRNDELSRTVFTDGPDL